MRPSGPLLFITLVITVSSCSGRALKSKLKELEKTIENKEYYYVRFEERMEGLRSGLASGTSDSLRWNCAYVLFKDYSYTNVDSCRKYLGVLEELSTDEDLKNRFTLCEARYLCDIKDRDGAMKKLAAVNSDAIPESFINDYYVDLDRCFTKLGENAKDWYLGIAEEALAIPGLDEALRLKINARLSLMGSDKDTALDYFTRCFNVSTDYHNKAMAAYNIALILKTTDKEAYKYWCTEAAINDLKVPVREYSSLSRLSLALFEDNDIKLASELMNVVLDDALSGQYFDIIFKSAKTFSVMVDALNYSERSKMKTMRIFFASLIALIAVILSLLLRQLRQGRSLAASNKTISDLNGQLSDANRIKENYLFKYMKLSVTYLGQVNEMKHKMRKTLKEEGVDALIALVRTPPSHDVFIDFYKIFDDTFLSLYPDFVDEVNSLLKPELQFEKKTPMKMEMRILAAIRLGFTDSGQIAEFLHCAPNSIYTNRSKLKRCALCDKDEFENRIRKLA